MTPAIAPKKILVPVSYAPSNVKAFRTAATMAASYGAKLIALNVTREPRKLLFSAGGSGFDEMKAQVKIENKEHLDEFVKDNLKAIGIEIDVERINIEGDDFEDAVIEVAKANGVDLIVLGHHEETRLEHLLFGRNVDRIVDGAECDVVVTRTKLFKELGRKEKAA
jgi:nucleotide-binding universal stress UspA family protein